MDGYINFFINFIYYYLQTNPYVFVCMYVGPVDRHVKYRATASPG